MLPTRGAFIPVGLTHPFCVVQSYFAGCLVLPFESVRCLRSCMPGGGLGSQAFGLHATPLNYTDLRWLVHATAGLAWVGLHCVQLSSWTRALPASLGVVPPCSSPTATVPLLLPQKHSGCRHPNKIGQQAAVRGVPWPPGHSHT